MSMHQWTLMITALITVLTQSASKVNTSSRFLLHMNYCQAGQVRRSLLNSRPPDLRRSQY